MSRDVDESKPSGDNARMAECSKCGRQAGQWQTECAACKAERLYGRKPLIAECPHCSKVTRVMVSTDAGTVEWSCAACGFRWERV